MPVGWLIFLGFMLLTGQRWALWFLMPMLFFWIIPTVLRAVGQSIYENATPYPAEKPKNDEKAKRTADEPQAYALGDDGELIPLYDDDQRDDDAIIYERRMKRDDTI